MFDNYHNSNPNHGTDLISYIYGEMDEAGQNAFESHLATCDKCAIELGEYSNARLGVVEWRRNDFEHLATPAIIIPSLQPASLVAAERKPGIFASVIEAIGALSGFAQASLGLAAAALLIGIFYFVLI